MSSIPFKLSEKDAPRFWRKVAIRGPRECWPWLGALSRRDYGQFHLDGKEYRATRISLQEKIGRELTQHEVACHSCDEPLCVNPRHLWPGTTLENVHDAMTKGRRPGPAYNVNKTHCPEGHRYSEENTYISPRGYRYCRECARVKRKVYQDRKKAEKERGDG